MKLVQGLRSQFILLAFLCIAGTITLTSYRVIERERRLLEGTLQQQGLMLGKTSAILFTNAFIYEELGLLESAGMAEYLEYYVTDVMAMDSRIVSFLVFDKDHHIVTHNDIRHYGTFFQTEDYDLLEHNNQPVIRQKVIDGKPLLEILVPLAIESKQWGGCRILLSMREIENAAMQLQLEVLRAASISLLISFLIIGFAADYFIKPLQKLSHAMELITTKGDISTPVPDLPHRKDEIGQLQQSFQWMTSRLQDEEKARLQTLEKLVHTEKMATVGQLTASIAHEINNPLGGVILCFNNLTEGKLDEKSREQHVEVIHASLKRMRETMRDLLDYSRQSELSIRKKPLSEIVYRSIALIEVMMKQQGIELRMDLPQDLPEVFLDSFKMQQVIVNIAVNAIHAMSSGGILRIAGDFDDEYVSLTLSDTGPGIPEELHAKIFDPFFTTKEPGKGTGLGLALSRSIVEQHGGKLLLAQTGTAGSSFAIVLRYTGATNEQ